MRDHAIETLEKLESGKIDVAEAGVTGKLYETVISSIKTQLQYSEMNGVTPYIEFMGDARPTKTVKGVRVTTKKIGQRKS